MSHQPLTPLEPVAPAIPELSGAAPIDHRALGQLSDAFAKFTPIGIVVDDGNGRAAQVLDRFAHDVANDTDVVRISEPFLDSMTFMRQVIAGVGFQTADLSLTDLDSIFRMFLSYQKTHSRRTVICVEEAQDQGAWVLDKMCQFVEFEEEKNFGLFIVLVGRKNLIGSLTEPPLDALSGVDSAVITVAPLALRETRELVRRCVASEGESDVARVFDFKAINRIHKLSAGALDTIGSLCGECVQMLDKENDGVVTTGLVNKAAKSLGLFSSPPMDELEEEFDEVEESRYPASGQLIVRKNGRVVQTLMVDKESVLIGRDQRCDVCVISPVISRQHALIVNSPAGVKLVDLGSTNGTLVNGERVERCSLKENEVIVVGDCRIEFVSADYGPIAFDTEGQQDGEGESAHSSIDDDSVYVTEEQDEGTRLMAVEPSGPS